MKVSNPALWLVAIALQFVPIHTSLGEVLISKDGREIVVTILSVTGDEVSFRRDGAEKVYTLPLSKLSDESVSMLEEWEPSAEAKAIPAYTKDTLPNLNITFSAGKSNRISKKERFDDRTEIIKPVVTIENRDLKTDFVGVKMTVVTFARGLVDSTSIKVLTKNSFDVDIKALEKASYRCSQASSEYDKQGYAKYGHKYQGYAVVITDKNGNIILTKGTPPRYEAIPELVLKVTAGKLYESKQLKKGATWSGSRTE